MSRFHGLMKFLGLFSLFQMPRLFPSRRNLPYVIPLSAIFGTQNANSQPTGCLSKTMIPNHTHTTDETEFSPISRRRLISGASLAGLAWLGSSVLGSAVTRGPNVNVVTARSRGAAPAAQAPVSSSALADLPEEWLVAHGKLAGEYFRYLNSLKLKSISAEQVIEAHAKQKGGVWNRIPAKIGWRRMAYTLKVTDRIAQEMNVSDVEIISAFRSPEYNARCRGARTHSWHQHNLAVDVKFPVRASKVTAMARQLRDEGLFRGGVGGYWNFTHIDARGENINW